MSISTSVGAIEDYLQSLVISNDICRLTGYILRNYNLERKDKLQINEIFLTYEVCNYRIKRDK